MQFVSILRKQNPFALGIAALAFAFALCVGYEMAARQWPWVFYWSKARQANKVIAAVNSFQSRYDRLPNTLADMGLENSESGPVYYQKTSDSTYFGAVLGESANVRIGYKRTALSHKY